MTENRAAWSIRTIIVSTGSLILWGNPPWYLTLYALLLAGGLIVQVSRARTQYALAVSRAQEDYGL